MAGFVLKIIAMICLQRPSHVAELTKDHILGKKVLFGHPFTPPTHGNPWCLNKNLQ